MTFDFDDTLAKYTKKPGQMSTPEQIMIYGPYGSGKTRLAASASEVEGLYPVLVIDNEGSTTGVVDQFDQERVKVIRIKESFPGREYDGFKSIVEGLLTKEHSYKTVVIDTLGSVLEWAKRKGEKPGDGFAKWNFVHEELTADNGLIQRLRDAPFLSVLVLHEKKEQPDEDGPSYAEFRWQGQGTGMLGQYPDNIWYITRDTNSAGVSKSTMLTRANKRSNAKNRFDLPHKIEDPDLAKIYAFIRNNNQEDK